MSRQCIKGRAEACQEAAISGEARAHMSDILHPVGRRFDEANRGIVSDARTTRSQVTRVVTAHAERQAL